MISPGITFNQRRYRLRVLPHRGWPMMIGVIDIFFLSMLFVALSSQSAKVSGISIDLPHVPGAQISRVEKYVVSLTRNSAGECQIFFQDAPSSFEQLAAGLSQLQSDAKVTQIIVRADRGVPYEEVVRIINLAQNAGIASFLAVVSDSGKQDTRFDQ